MSRPLFEPNEYTALAGHSWALTDISKRSLAGAWVEPTTGSPDPLWVPVYQNGWDTATAPLETFAFRRHKDGSLEFKGHLDATGATSGTIAFTLPGLGVGEPNYWDENMGDQYFHTTITPDGATFSLALVFIDSTTLDVTVTWPAT
jgi:hypothetical protein